MTSTPSFNRTGHFRSSSNQNEDLGFAYRVRKSGDVEILHHGRMASTLRGADADDFRRQADNLSAAQMQHLMARLTGNYRRGNERRAGKHPRNPRL